MVLRERDSERSKEDAGPSVAPADLARSLGFLRASNLQVMRLQLAAERQDRRGIMAAMDELVALDRALGRFIDTLPGAAPAGAAAPQREVMEQRLILSRGKSGPAFRAPGVAKRAAMAEQAPDHGPANAVRADPGALWLSSALILLGLCCIAAAAILYALTGSLTAWLEVLR